MSLPKYPEYKDSGVEWLASVPAHWGISQSRRMFAVRSESALASDRMLTASQKYGVLFQSDFVEREGRRVVEVIMGIENLKHVEPNDFIISMRSFQGGIEWCKLRGSTSFHYVMLKPIKHVWPPFFAHLFKSTQYIQALRRTTDLIRDGQELRYSNFAQVDLPIVPLEEQKAIAAFLDRETSKIDALIAEQEKLLVLLAEKRQATISLAVTRGVNPDVPMRESGVPWLGEVPLHWQLSPMKHAVRFQRGHDLPTEEREEGRVPVVSSGGVSGWHNQAATTGPTIVTGRYGTIGEFTLVEEDCWPLNTALYTIEMHSNLPKYLWYMLQSLKHIFILNSLKTAVPGVDRNDIHPTIVCLPPVSEQSTIVAFLDAEIAKLNALGAEAERAINLLKERRSALIAAGVTGKIDVRGVAVSSVTNGEELAA